MIEFSALVQSARAVTDIARGALDARDHAKAKEAVAELQGKLHEIMSAALASAEKAAALQAALSQAEREKAEIKAKVEDRALYKLHAVRPGAHVYAPKETVDGTQPAHCLCQPCYDKGNKVVLRASLDGRLLQCPEEAKHNITVEARAPVQVPRRGSSWNARDW